MKTLPIEVNSDYWFRMITHYQNLLMEKYLYIPMTPAAQYQMRIYFNDLIIINKNKETHPAWHIPLELVFNLNRQTVDIKAIDQESIVLI
jgi:hypothetical protein